MCKTIATRYQMVSCVWSSLLFQDTLVSTYSQWFVPIHKFCTGL